MMAETVKQFPMLGLSCLGLLLFLGVFIGILVHTFALSSDEKTHRRSLLALDPEDRAGLKPVKEVRCE